MSSVSSDYLVIGSGLLEFPWDLVLGIWDFSAELQGNRTGCHLPAGDAPALQSFPTVVDRRYKNPGGTARNADYLVIGYWNFLGIWCLGFGISQQGCRATAPVAISRQATRLPCVGC
jgi:hypothetical protein